MKQVIVITGASSGFGALTARALADAGHIVYASMRETTGRNAAQVATPNPAASRGPLPEPIPMTTHADADTSAPVPGAAKPAAGGPSAAPSVGVF